MSLAITYIVFAVVITFFLTFAGTNGWNWQQFNKANDTSENHKYVALLDELQQLYDDIYIDEIDEDELADYVAAGFIAGTGDTYAAYYNAEGYASLKEDMNGDMQGIGVSVIYNGEEKAIEIISVFPDSPAYENGIEPGDLVVYVSEDGENYESVAEVGYNVALQMLKGEAGTTAAFALYRASNPDDLMYFEIERREVVEMTVSYRVYSLDSSVGIIQISSFDGKTPAQFEEAVNALVKEGVEKLVFDVRNNPGGELNSVCSILDMLLPEGPIIRTIDKSGEEQVARESDANEIDMPMAVVVNSNTASAAELFSSSLQDYKKASIVGTVTYGKGCMQTMFPLSNGGCLSLTSALYCPPFSDNYNGIGVKPDVESELTGDAATKNLYKLTDEEDTQLKDAANTFNK